jgi:hypothetical protein
MRLSAERVRQLQKRGEERIRKKLIAASYVVVK